MMIDEMMVCGGVGLNNGFEECCGLASRAKTLVELNVELDSPTLAWSNEEISLNTYVQRCISHSFEFG